LTTQVILESQIYTVTSGVAVLMRRTMLNHSVFLLLLVALLLVT
jgi:hypothetical protein